MTRYELSITKDYRQQWSVTDAVRELFQNALDQQTVNPDNQMFFEYETIHGENEPYGVLNIGNKQSKLEARSLLLGATTKANDENTIGQFGEGYKIATLVLLRAGKNVIFYNYGAREVWRPRFSKSKKYGEEILVFDVDKKHVWSKVPDNDLTIVVTGITAAEYQDIVTSNLHLQAEHDKLETAKGEVLLDPVHAKKVFVNGLFVQEYDKYTYGYNFKPQYLKLDTDRKLVSDFELRWLASEMWASLGSGHDLLMQLIEKSAGDVEYYFSILSHNRPQREVVTEAIAAKFVEKHGVKAVPVSTQHEAETVSEQGFKPVIVNENTKKAIEYSSTYKAPAVKLYTTPKEELADWYEKHKQSFSNKAKKEFKRIYEKL